MRTGFCLIVLMIAVAPLARGQDSAEKDPAKLIAQAQEQLKDGKLDDALVTAKKAIALDPKDDRSYAFASNAARLAGKYAESLQLAEQAVKLNESMAVYHALVAFAACKEHELEICRAACKKALSLPPQGFDQEGYRELQVLNNVMGVRKLKFTWPLRLEKGIVRQGKYPVAVPPDTFKGQTASIEVTGTRGYKLVKQGDNRVLQLDPSPKDDIELILHVTLDPYSYKQDLARYQKKPIPRDIQPFLGSSEAINPKSPTLQKIAKGLRDDNPITTVKNILAWQKEHLKYKDDPKATFKATFDSVDEVVRRGEGECRAWSELFTGLCRAAGVPARHFWGLVLLVPDDKNPKGGIRSHVWAEVYITGAGWVPVDPQDANLFGFLPNTYIRIYTDMRKSRTSLENLPVLNLLAMGSDGFRFESLK
jgi:transglutaminase-like putative cysteine protease